MFSIVASTAAHVRTQTDRVAKTVRNADMFLVSVAETSHIFSFCKFSLSGMEILYFHDCVGLKNDTNVVAP